MLLAGGRLNAKVMSKDAHRVDDLVLEAQLMALDEVDHID
jgi:hypothetical protein